MNPDHDEYSVAFNPSPSAGELTVLFSGEAQPISLHKMGPTIHDYYLIHTALSGYGDFMIRGTPYRCGAGDSFVIFPGELFWYQADEISPWRYAWFAFNGPGAAATLEAIGVSPESPVVPGSLNPHVRNAYAQLRRCFDTSPSPELSNLEAEGWLRLLLHQLGAARAKKRLAAPAPTDSDHAVKQALQYLTLQFAQPISVSHMASMFGYHRTHLCKLFKQAIGMSPMQYLLQIRMQRAELLLASSMTIEQVASSVGYGDALYFSKKFHAWSGFSPTEYRKQLRKVSADEDERLDTV